MEEDEVEYTIDGNQIACCRKGNNFDNVAFSVGFGETKEEAYEDLLREEKLWGR